MSHDVCKTCGSCPPNETWVPWQAPIGVAFHRRVPCALNAELGVSHARLPVTHTRPDPEGQPNRQPDGGLWFYYSRGCSDLYFDVGRTLTARNVPHARWRRGWRCWDAPAQLLPGPAKRERGGWRERAPAHARDVVHRCLA